MATIQEALRAAHGQVRVSAAKAAELHALLTDLNYHTEAALLEARQHGLTHLIPQLERIAALRNERGSLRGLADDGTPLYLKRNQLLEEIEAHKASEGRTSNPRKVSPEEITAAAAEVRQAIADFETLFAEGEAIAAAIKRAEDKAIELGAAYPVYGQPGWTQSLSDEYRSRVGDVYDERARLQGPVSKEFYARYRVAEKALERAEKKYARLVPSHQNYRYAVAIRGGIPVDHPMRPQNHRTGNPSSETERVRSAIVGLRSFVAGSLDGTPAAHTGEHFTVDQPIYADGGASTTHLNSYAAERFNAAQAAGERAASRGDKTWYVIRSQNLPIAWHTPAGWTVVHKSTVVGANPTTSRNIAIVKGALGLR